MAEDRYLYNPVEQRTSFADELQKQAELIRGIQAQNIAGAIKQGEAQRAARKAQLSLVNKFNTNDWSPEAVEAFGQVNNELSRRVDAGYYSSTDEFRQDLLKVASLHSGIDGHFSQTKKPYEDLVGYATDPSSYPDDSVKVIDDADLISSKRQYADVLGLDGIKVDLENLDITGNYIDVSGQLIEGGYGSVLGHPMLGSPDIFSPSLEPLGDLDPSDFADKYLVNKAKALISAGEAPETIRKKMYSAMDRYLDKDSDVFVGRGYNTAQNLYGDLGSGEVEGVSFIKAYEDEVMKYVPLSQKERGYGRRKAKQLILDRIDSDTAEYDFGTEQNAAPYVGPMTTYVMTDLETARGVQIKNPSFDPTFNPNSAEGMLMDAATIKLKQTRYLTPDFREITVIPELNRIVVPTEYEDIQVDLENPDIEDKKVIAQIEQALNKTYEGAITIYDLLDPKAALSKLESEPSEREYVMGEINTPPPIITQSPDEEQVDPLNPDNY